MKNKHFETLAIRTQVPQTDHNEHAVPLYLTSSFTFDSAEEGAAIFAGEKEAYLYSRFSNPNVDEFVRKLALMENTETGIGTASGMAAVYVSMVAFLKQGDHIISSSAIFGNTKYILSNILPGMGVTCTYVDVDDNEAYAKAVQPNTKMLYVESPSNPTLKMADLAFLGKLCKDNDILFSVDNCFATPYLQTPKEYGADLIIHSATKYLDGQGRILGGAILGSKEVITTCYDFLRRTGSTLSAFNAWILSKSLETLAVRMDRHCSNALKIAQFLESHPEVEKVTYPGLPSHPQHDLAMKQMKQGGGLVACIIKGGRERGAKFLNQLQIHSLTANLGDTRSIATHPASTTHSKLSEEEQMAVDIMPGLIRFSVGLEHIDDLIQDIDQALTASK